MRLDPNKPIETRCGYQVKIYEAFAGRYFNGAYYDSTTDIWYVRQWDKDGYDEEREKALDLVNRGG